MPGLMISKPDAAEYMPYYGKYIALVPDGDVVGALRGQLDETLALLSGVDEARGAHRYAPDKWSVKELVGHVIDTERIFAYRALRFARKDETPLSGFEQDDYIRAGSFNDYQLGELAEEFAHVRRANLALFQHLNAAAWVRTGLANGHAVSVRALAYITAGHELHHREILRTRYL